MDSTHAACHHDTASAPSESQIGDLIARAEKIALAVGEKWTTSRARVYELLIRAGAPVKAYDLIRRTRRIVSPSRRPSIALWNSWRISGWLIAFRV